MAISHKLRHFIGFDWSENTQDDNMTPLGKKAQGYTEWAQTMGTKTKHSENYVGSDSNDENQCNVSVDSEGGVNTVKQRLIKVEHNRNKTFTTEKPVRLFTQPVKGHRRMKFNDQDMEKLNNSISSRNF